MQGYLLRRLVSLAITLLGITIAAFSLMHVLPGDPALAILGQDASAEDIELLRRRLGLDEPLPVQYQRFLLGLLRGDLGDSLVRAQSVGELIRTRLPATFELAVLGMTTGFLIAVVLGVISAVKQYTVVDHLTRVIALLGVSMPVFLLGILLILLFSVYWNVVPSFGRGPGLVEALAALLTSGTVAPLKASLERLLLPSLSLALPLAGVNMRLVRSSMLEVLRQEYISTARAKGLGERRVIYRHALRNALIPVLTMSGMQFGVLLGGSFIVETMFSWPGLGRLTITAIHQRDYTVVQGVLLVVGLLMCLINLVVDLAYSLVDPRIRYS